MSFSLNELVAMAAVVVSLIGLNIGIYRRINDRMTREIDTIKLDLEKDVVRVEKTLSSATEARAAQISEVHKRIDDLRTDLANTPTKQDFQNGMTAITNVLEALRQDLRHVSGRVDALHDRKG